MIRYTLYDPETGLILGHGTNTASALFAMRARMETPVGIAVGFHGDRQREKIQPDEKGQPRPVELTAAEREAVRPVAQKLEMLTVDQFLAAMAKRGIPVTKDDLQPPRRA